MRTIHPVLSMDHKITIHGPKNGTNATPGALTPLRFPTMNAGRDKPRKKKSRRMISHGPTLVAPTSIAPTIVSSADVLDRALRAVRASPNFVEACQPGDGAPRASPSRFARPHLSMNEKSALCGAFHKRTRRLELPTLSLGS